MKIKYNLITGLILACMINSYGQYSNVTIIDPNSDGNAIALPTSRIEDSVIFIQDLSHLNSKNANEKQTLTMEIINFDSRYKLLPAYMIGGVEYCDNGQFNDKVAGDGIFTSVNKYRIKYDKSIQGVNIMQSSKFKYTSELTDLLNSKFGSTSNKGVKFGCKIRTLPCPETNWWNSCVPLASPCPCVEFYDCHFEIEF